MSDRVSPKHRKVATGVLGAVSLAVLALLYTRFFGAYIDDAFISFRYADNLASGYGLTFNPGERVEGYTNFLWVLVLAGSAKLGADIPVAASILSMACGVALLVWMVVLSRQRALLKGPLGLFAAWLLLTNSSFQFWVAGGLETTAYALALFAGTCFYIDSLEARRSVRVALAAFFVAALLRPDGALFLALAALHHLLRSGPVAAGKTFLPFVLVGVVYVSWRVSYFGDLLPNTYYQKTGGGLAHVLRGVDYLWSYVVYYGPLALLPILGLWLSRPLQPWVRIMASISAAQILYVVLIGGDGLNLYRFWVPILPFVFLLVQEGLMSLVQAAKARFSDRRIAVWAAAGSACALILASSFDHYDHLPKHNIWIGDRVAVGQWLFENTPPDATIALNPVGAVGYYSKRPVIDMLGLTNRHIAQMEPVEGTSAGHDKGDGAYVLSREPDWILLGNVDVGSSPREKLWLTFLSERQIWEAPEFHDRYEQRTVKFGSRHLRAWTRKASDSPIRQGSM